MNRSWRVGLLIAFVLILGLACLAAPVSTPSEQAPSPVVGPSSVPTGSLIPVPPATDLPIVSHLAKPAEIAAQNKQTLVYDADSSLTAAGKRAPYGDSLALDRLERPFLNDMTYVPDLNILSFSLAQDAQWDYVSIQLEGNNPNNPLGIDYGVELDVNGDGFGDYLVWAQPPYTADWDPSHVRVLQDTNHDTGIAPGSSPTGDGYDKLIFDGGSSSNPDPDLAWVRMVEGLHATVQLAFKKSFIPTGFGFDVIADGGIKDPAKMDYSSQFTQAEAGSPLHSSQYYPLGSLYAVDNTCTEAYHIRITANEAMFCPALQAAATRKPRDTSGSVSGCNPPPNCGGGPYDPNTCTCQ